jgi:formate hydrogenlyase subunit 4
MGVEVELLGRCLGVLLLTVSFLTSVLGSLLVLLVLLRGLLVLATVPLTAIVEVILTTTIIVVLVALPRLLALVA